MRRWLTILVFVMALAVPALAQNSTTTTTTTQQQAQPAQTVQSNNSTRQTSTTTTTQRSSTPVERTTGIDPLYLALGAVALITIIAIALLAARGRRNRDVVAVRESKTVIKE